MKKSKFVVYYIASKYLDEGMKYLLQNKPERKRIENFVGTKLSDHEYLQLIYDCIGLTGFSGKEMTYTEVINALARETGNKLYKTENINNIKIASDFDTGKSSEITKHRIAMVEKVVTEGILYYYREKVQFLVRDFSQAQTIEEQEEVFNKLDKVIDEVVNTDTVRKVDNPNSNIVHFSNFGFSDSSDNFIVHPEDDIEECIKFIKSKCRNFDTLISNGKMVSVEGINNVLVSKIKKYGSYQNLVYRCVQLQEEDEYAEELQQISTSLTILEVYRRLFGHKTLRNLTDGIYKFGEIIYKDTKLVTGYGENLAEITIIDKELNSNSMICNLQNLDSILELKSLNVDNDGVIKTYSKTVWEKLYSNSIPKDGNYNNLQNINI